MIISRVFRNILSIYAKRLPNSSFFVDFECLCPVCGAIGEGYFSFYADSELSDRSDVLAYCIKCRQFSQISLSYEDKEVILEKISIVEFEEIVIQLDENLNETLEYVV